jgi:hypothetical protein
MIPAGTPAGQGDLEMARALRAALRDLVTLRASPEAARADTGTLQRVNQTFSVHLLRVQGDLGGTAALAAAGVAYRRP